MYMKTAIIKSTILDPLFVSQFLLQQDIPSSLQSADYPYCTLYIKGQDMYMEMFMDLEKAAHSVDQQQLQILHVYVSLGQAKELKRCFKLLGQDLQELHGD